MPGWGSFLGLLPDRQVGVVVLTNRDPSPVPQMLAHAVFDAACGLEPIDWYARFAQARLKALADEAAQRERDSVAADAAEAVPARPLREYAGSYAEPAYGELRLSLEGEHLTWAWRGLGGPMRPRNHDVFLLEETAPARHAEPFVGTFLHDPVGHVDRVAIPLEPAVPDIVFPRRA